jgi:beta-galactosidase
MKTFTFSRILIFSFLSLFFVCITNLLEATNIKSDKSHYSKKGSNSVREKINFNHEWQFYRMDSSSMKSGKESSVKTMYDTSRKDFSSQFLNEYISSGGNASQQIQKEVEKAITDFNREYPGIAKKEWQSVSLPHTAKIESLESGIHQWEGVCYYRKTFSIPSHYKGKKISIDFEGAMQQSDIWINGKLVSQHKGGYTPFSVDLTELVDNKEIEIIVRLDNRAGKDFPVGKDLKKNGFNYWSGIYRSVFLQITNPVHITDAVKMNKVAGGGVFFRTPTVTKDSAIILVKTNVINESANDQLINVKQQLKDKTGIVIAIHFSKSAKIAKGKDVDISQEFTVMKPMLWYPDSPSLYTLETTILADGKKVIDVINQKVGIRKLIFSKDEGFKINGEPIYLTGTNCHQDYPYIGNALSKDAQYRDMKKIKEAGFNCVRLAHYPHDPSIYEAADELGLMLLNSIPGWQFFNNNDLFKQRVYRDIRDMIHRDRNHPSVILWEANLNESYPPDAFRIKCHEIAHEELPVGEYYIVGETYGAKETHWDVAMNNWYDSKDSIFRNITERVQDVQPNDPGIIKEYADWEYGGLQSTTRCTRANGEKAMLTALWNTQWEHNSDIGNYGPRTVGDCTWAMFDNNCGGEKNMQEWGIADIFRVPKFTHFLFRSQLKPFQTIAGVSNSNPVVFISNWWTDKKENEKEKVVVYSNCEKIVLTLNGVKVGEQLPDGGPDTQYGVFDKGGDRPFDGGNCNHLKHPPFTFNNISFQKGELKAEGYIHDKKVAEQIVYTPQTPNAIKLEVDLSGRPFKADNSDAVFVYASLVDKNGTVACLDNNSEVVFSVTGGAKIVGPLNVKVRGGIATILLQSNTLTPGDVFITAQSKELINAFKIKLR